MTFEEILDQAIAMLQRRGRLTYGALKRQFQLDDAHLEDVKNELIAGQRLAVDEGGNVLVWTGAEVSASPPTASLASTQDRAPLAYTPPYLAEKIRTSRSALAGERKQVTVLFADLTGSLELLADRDPEEVQRAPRSGAGADDGGRAPLRRNRQPGHGRWHYGPVWGADCA